MGIIQSIFCSITFCIERVLTWTCCAFLLLTLMFSLIVLMVYGISIGYHHAQKELALFALSADKNPVTRGTARRLGDLKFEEDTPSPVPVVRLVAVNQTEDALGAEPQLEVYMREPASVVLLETSPTPVFLRVSESENGTDLARRLIGRIRRSRANSTSAPFFRPLRNRRFRAENGKSVSQPATLLFALTASTSALYNKNDSWSQFLQSLYERRRP